AERPRHAGEAASAARGVRRRAGAAVRLLHQRLDHDRQRVPEEEPEGERRPAARRARGIEVPLRHARRDPARDQARANADGLRETIMNAAFSNRLTAPPRREFLKASGALIVSASMPAFVSEAL